MTRERVVVGDAVYREVGRKIFVLSIEGAGYAAVSLTLVKKYPAGHFW